MQSVADVTMTSDHGVEDDRSVSETSMESGDDSDEWSMQTDDKSALSKSAKKRARKSMSKAKQTNGRKGKKSVSFAATVADDNISDIYNQLVGGRGAIHVIADDWVTDYNADREEATLALIQFIIRASGCKAKFTREMQEETNQNEVIRSLTDSFDQENAHDYPMTMAGAQWKKFRTAIAELFDKIVHQCQFA